MDLNTILGGLFPAGAGAGAANATTIATGNTSAPLHVVESLLPLLGLRAFAPMYRLVGSRLGWDPSVLLTALGVIWALNKFCRQVYRFVADIFSKHFMCTVHVSKDDDIYDHMIRWLALQPRLVNARYLMAETIHTTTKQQEDVTRLGRDPTGKYLNFSNVESLSPAQYIPAHGDVHGFWWKGNYYRLTRKRETLFDQNAGNGLNSFKNSEDLMISCFGRSPGPVKRLLAHAKKEYHRDHQALTTIKRPHLLLRRGGRGVWATVAQRHVRHMKTVVLDQEQKLQVLADMNEYLHPASASWYSNRGIPLRRGYLFHGPPGTGKTSLSFALAGVFGLDVHVISLLEPTLTEEDLNGLFSTLPRRCVVLLEDIDTAGLRRPVEDLGQAEEQSKKKSGPASDGSESRSNDIKELTRALKKENDPMRGISLSGLLNAIDGVASHEGRVLIMTTNVPESLDEALIRPGRVDLQVKFTNATRDQARELFIRMYEGDPGRPQHKVLEKAINGSADDNGQSVLSPETSSAVKAGELDISVDELPGIARQFSDKIPDQIFSPAEIQGYLLKRKKHPRQAMQEADKWVKALAEQKASKSKVVEVQ